MGLIGIPTGGIDKQTWYLIMLGVCLAVLAALAYVDRYSVVGVILKIGEARRGRRAGQRHQHLRRQADRLHGSAGLAGLSGALFAAYVRFLTPDLFNEQRVLPLPDDRGRRRHRQPVRRDHREPDADHPPGGAARARREQFRLLVYGTMVLFVLWFLPSGIGGVLERLRR